MVNSIDPEKEWQVAVFWHNFANTRGTSNAVVSWVCSQVVGCIPYAAAELELESWLGKQMPFDDRPQELQTSSCKVSKIRNPLDSELIKSASQYHWCSALLTFRYSAGVAYMYAAEGGKCVTGVFDDARATLVCMYAANIRAGIAERLDNISTTFQEIKEIECSSERF